MRFNVKRLYWNVVESHMWAPGWVIVVQYIIFKDNRSELYLKCIVSSLFSIGLAFHP